MGARPVPPMGAEHCSPFEIGRAAGRGKGEISGGGVSFKKKKEEAIGGCGLYTKKESSKHEIWCIRHRSVERTSADVSMAPAQTARIEVASARGRRCSDMRR